MAEAKKAIWWPKVQPAAGRDTALPSSASKLGDQDYFVVCDTVVMWLVYFLRLGLVLFLGGGGVFVLFGLVLSNIMQKKFFAILL